MPQPCGKGVHIIMFVGANSAGDFVTRQSQLEKLIYINCASINWLSERQIMVKSYMLGSELIALRVGMEILKRTAL